MLVACSLVNLTTWEQAEPAFRRLRTLGVEGLAAADPSSLHDLLRPLGLWRRRSVGLVRLAQAWLRSRPTCAKDVERLPSCGKYAADSWAIFVEGRTDVEPTDGKLGWYLERIKESQE